MIPVNLRQVQSRLTGGSGTSTYHWKNHSCNSKSSGWIPPTYTQFKGDPTKRLKVTWTCRNCVNACFHWQDLYSRSVGASQHAYFLAWNSNSLGHSHVGLGVTFTNEECNTVDLLLTECTVCMPQMPGMLMMSQTQSKWQYPPQPCFHDFQTPNLNKLAPQ